MQARHLCTSGNTTYARVQSSFGTVAKLLDKVAERQPRMKSKVKDNAVDDFMCEPEQKRTKLDVNARMEVAPDGNGPPSIDIVPSKSVTELNHELNAAKIDNLEHFPMEILLEIFSRTDDVRLVNLSGISHRFAAITPIVFKDKYDSEYFVLNGERIGGDPDVYWAQLNRFGNYIKAIEMKNVGAIDES